ncbi:sigma-70 family RNA polymerase sigma factor [Streptomyces roseolus]|uniref:sigma-70 family RNA polymerase sigma factor n=1 Tax=Streptomyces roseolus TaxID=67358 RepID=UPI00365BC58E
MTLDLRAALAALHRNLQQASIDGVVPADAFEAEVARLGLDAAARSRLAAELNRMGLRTDVRIVEVSTISDAQDVEKVAPRPVPPRPDEAVGPAVGLLLDLVARYAEAGSVPRPVVAGVARLAGLGASDSAALLTAAAARFTVRAEAVGPESAPDAGPTLPEPSPDAPAVTTDGLEAAVTAALCVLDEDRFARRPEKRILTADEEVGLSVLLRGGVEGVGVEPTAEELAALPSEHLRRRARDCLISHNQGLVHSLARKHTEQGLEYEDLFQHGVLGLMTAIRKYDATQGNKLSTYATWWIRQALTRAVADEGSAIRVPVHMHETMQKVAREERRLISAGRYPTVADVAVACDLPVGKVEKIRRISKVTDSLDRVIGDGTSLGELVEGRTAIPSVEGTVLQLLSDEDVHRLVALLPTRYAYVVNRRVGLAGHDPATLDVIGTELKVTRERVRQLEAQVLPVLRLAFEAPGEDPYRTLESMLTDPRVGSNPVGTISRDLKSVKWGAGVVAMRAFHTRTGHASPSEDHLEGGFPLGAWAAEQRTTGGTSGSGLPAHRRIILSLVGFRWRRAAETPPQPPQGPRRTRTTVHPGVAVPPPDAGPGPGPTAEEEPGADDGMPATVPLPEPLPSKDRTSRADLPAAPVDEVPTSDATDDEGAATDDAPAVGRAGGSDTPVLTDASAAAGGPRRARRWEEAVELPVPLDRNVRWMARYTLLALGDLSLAGLLGPASAQAVIATAEGGQLPDRSVAESLRVLVKVLDALKERARRPEDFFDRPSSALLGQCPTRYLTAHPLVKPEGRLALIQALEEFALSDTDTGPTPPDDAAQPDLPPAEDRLREAEQLLRERETDIARRVAAARADERDKARAGMEAEVARRVEESRHEADRLLRKAREAAEERLREALEAAEARAREAREEILRLHEAVSRTAKRYELRLRENDRAAARRTAELEERLGEAQAEIRRLVTNVQAREHEAAERVRAVERWAEKRVAEAQENSRSLVAEREARLPAPRPAPPQQPDPRKWWRRG